MTRVDNRKPPHLRRKRVVIFQVARDKDIDILRKLLDTASTGPAKHTHALYLAPWVASIADMTNAKRIEAFGRRRCAA